MLDEFNITLMEESEQFSFQIGCIELSDVCSLLRGNFAVIDVLFEAPDSHSLQTKIAELPCTSSQIFFMLLDYHVLLHETIGLPLQANFPQRISQGT